MPATFPGCSCPGGSNAWLEDSFQYDVYNCQACGARIQRALDGWKVLRQGQQSILATNASPQDGTFYCPACKNEKLNHTDSSCWRCGNKKLEDRRAQVPQASENKELPMGKLSFPVNFSGNFYTTNKPTFKQTISKSQCSQVCIEHPGIECTTPEYWKLVSQGAGKPVTLHNTALVANCRCECGSQGQDYKP